MGKNPEFQHLLTIISDPVINDLIVKYATLQYNNSLNSLKNAADSTSIYRLQGQVYVWEHMMHLKDRVYDMVQKGT